MEILGGSGEPDIVAHDLKNNALYIYSLKNYTIKHYLFIYLNLTTKLIL